MKVKRTGDLSLWKPTRPLLFLLLRHTTNPLPHSYVLVWIYAFQAYAWAQSSPLPGRWVPTRCIRSQSDMCETRESRRFAGLCTWHLQLELLCMARSFLCCLCVPVAPVWSQYISRAFSFSMSCSCGSLLLEPNSLQYDAGIYDMALPCSNLPSTHTQVFLSPSQISDHSPILTRSHPHHASHPESAPPTSAGTNAHLFHLHQAVVPSLLSFSLLMKTFLSIFYLLII